uniref:Liprin-beta-1 n=1 Tax=Aceria tosichella TaxID=561515 RepID=A0A6G1SA66_9ACAR
MLKESHTSSSADAKPSAATHQQQNQLSDSNNQIDLIRRTCSQFEKLLQQELTNRAKLEAENDALKLTVNRLRNQIKAHEKERSANNELIRVLNATLMERETEVSILKLKMTRIQTNSSSASISQHFNPPSNPSLVRQDPCKAYTMAGRSNSEFTRNSTARSTMMAEVISTRSSTSQLQQQHSDDRDALVWATVPEELTPSKRPVLLERNLPQLYEHCNISSPVRNQSSTTPILRDRRYRTLPRSMKSPIQAQNCVTDDSFKQQTDTDTDTRESNDTPTKQPPPPAPCRITNLDDSNNTGQSGGNKSSAEANSNQGSEIKSRVGEEVSGLPITVSSSEERQTTLLDNNSGVSGKNKTVTNAETSNFYSAIGKADPQPSSQSNSTALTLEMTKPPPNLTQRSPPTPVKFSTGLKKIFGKFKRSNSSETGSQSRSDLRSGDPPLPPTTGAFQRGSTRSTLVGPPSTSFRAQMSPLKAVNFQTDKPFAEWDTNMLVDWLTMIGLSMYANQCRRWVECGAHIMNATPAEVDKGLGITNHLHRKKLRLAISELNGDCDKITKAASKLDYLWVARWLDDIGLPQYKEAFINARVDGRVLNYLTVEDLVSMGVKSLLHHASIRCGIRVLRSINFDLQLLKRRATAEEIEQMNSIRESMDVQSDSLVLDKTIDGQQVRVCNESDVPLWTCHRVMEWLRMIDFAEFAPNLRGSGVHGGLIMYEDAFSIDTMSTLLSIPISRTLLRRHLSTFFENLIGKELAQRKKHYKEQSSNQKLNPASEIKTPKKSPLWFTKLKSSKVGQDGMDEYLCPMYPVEPQIIKSPARKAESSRRESSNLPEISENINA